MAATAVTPVGVRDGDPDALAGLCDRRGPAVLAYCEVVAGRGDVAIAAAAEALASFRVGVVAAPDLANLNPEALLISATRHAAARYAGSDMPEPHSRVTALLAARADRSITLADHDWLEEHLAQCWTCRAPVARFEAADRAYRDPPNTRLDPEAAAILVAALAAAAPVRGAVGPEPTVFTNGSGRRVALPEPEPEPEPEYVEQPTAAWQVGIDDPELHEPTLDDDAAAVRRERRSAPSASKRGLTRRPRSERKRERDAGRPRRADADRPPPQAGVQRARSSRDERAAAVAAAIDTPPASASRTGGGASLPRPRRTVGSRPSASHRSRGSLRPGVVLPVALVVLAIIVALLIAGVFGGAEPASAPQSFAPSPTEPANADAAPVVVVPNAATASAAAVERAKAKARAARRREDATKAAGAPAARDSATALPTPVTTPPPPADTPATPADRGTDQGSGGASPKIDAGKDATGTEDLPGTQDTSTVPELAPPAAGPAPPG